jgi:hypothetical protein
MRRWPVCLILACLPARARAEVPPTLPAPGPVDRALAPVLRSGCLEGLSELEAVAARLDLGESDRAVAARVLAVCRRLLATGTAPPASPAPDRSGRGKLVFGSTLYGIWAGVAADIIADLEGRALVVPPLVGGGAGLALALLATREGPMTSGQAWGIITGFDYGTYSGLLWGAAANSDDEKVVVGTALGTGLAAGAAATWLMTSRPARQGDIEVVRSGGLWGFATGALLAGIVQPESNRTTFSLMGAGMDGGLLAGVGLAHLLDVPRNRMLLIDTATLGGGLLGFAVAFLAVGEPEGGQTGRVLAASALGGLYAGMAAGIYLTRDMQPDQNEARADVPALAVRGIDGRWRTGQLALIPLVGVDHRGRSRLTGALAPLVGGLW